MPQIIAFVIQAVNLTVRCALKVEHLRPERTLGSIVAGHVKGHDLVEQTRNPLPSVREVILVTSQRLNAFCLLLTEVEKLTMVVEGRRNDPGAFRRPACGKLRSKAGNVHRPLASSHDNPRETAYDMSCRSPLRTRTARGHHE